MIPDHDLSVELPSKLGREAVLHGAWNSRLW